ncbi:MAG: tripartite tricarboxylate transporter substrate binding protein [Burkholderiales bacterium]|nr:tripartite tricarboxylate transporter substrate binding protein [Burkholderiales bacterium]
MAHTSDSVRVRLLVAYSALLAIFGAETSTAQMPAGYPARPLTVIVPFPAGGGVDILARVIAKHLSPALGKPVVVDNRGGGGGNIGIGAAARAKPDGYTFLITSSIFVNNPSLYKQVPFDPIRDFTPMVLITASPNVIVTRADSGINTLADLIALARNKPDLLNYSSPGIGTSSHLSAELFKLKAKINLTHVPYSGSAPGLKAVLAGETQLGVFGIAGGGGGQISSGRLRALVHTGHGRLRDFPDVPNLAEAGFPNSEAENFNSMLAPAGTSEEVMELVAREVIAVLKRPEVIDTLRQTGGVNVVGGDRELLRARIAKELPLWREVIEKAAIKVE